MGVNLILVVTERKIPSPCWLKKVIQLKRLLWGKVITHKTKSDRKSANGLNMLLNRFNTNS